MNHLIKPIIKIAVGYCGETLINCGQNDKNYEFKRKSAGFSLIELLIVITIISIMSSVTIFSYLGNRNAYRTEDQAFRIIDSMRVAKQTALSERQVMRFEIDMTDKVIRIIDEGPPGAGTADDRVIKQVMLDDAGIVRIDAQPSNVSVFPNVNPAVSPALAYPIAAYTVSSHPLSNGHKVFAARFQSNGSVTSSDGTAAPMSATLYVWQPEKNTNNALPLGLVWAVTLFGGVGTTKYWQYDGNAFVSR